MERIKFGLDGWRGIIAKDFTLVNAVKVAYAVTRWLVKKYKEPLAVVGYDCRFGGEMFMEAVAKILASQGVRVLISESFVSTPMISLAVKKTGSHCGIAITASHSPAEYNGLKFKGQNGGPISTRDLFDIENLMTDDYQFDIDLLNWNQLIEQGKIQYMNFEAIYIKHIQDNIDLNLLQTSKLKFVFDPMYGSSQNVIKKVLSNVETIHDKLNPTFMGIPPNPAPKNLHELIDLAVQQKGYDCAFAVDGDGDRLALVSSQGELIDAHHILLLIVYYLSVYKKLEGKVVAGFAVTSRLDKLCKHLGLEVIRTKVGFTHIAEVLVQEEVLVGGEENGGIAMGDVLPDKDGIWTGLQIWSWLAESGKKIEELLEEVYEITDRFVCRRFDLKLNKKARLKILENCKNGVYKQFGEFIVINEETLDGYKYYFAEDEWILIRPSTFYPVLRIYIEAHNEERVNDILIAINQVLTNNTK